MRIHLHPSTTSADESISRSSTQPPLPRSYASLSPILPKYHHAYLVYQDRYIICRLNIEAEISVTTSDSNELLRRVGWGELGHVSWLFREEFDVADDSHHVDVS